MSQRCWQRGVEPPRGQKPVPVVSRGLVVSTKDGTPGFTGVREIVRPRKSNIVGRWRNIGIGDKHYFPAIEGMEMACVRSL